MKKTLTYAIIMVLAAMAAMSCSKEKLEYPIAFSVQATGSVSGNTFTEDNGLVYEIAQVMEGVEVSDMDRAFARFDVLRKISDKRYSIRLIYLFKPLCKNPLEIGNASDEDLVSDPIRISDGWITGGYINMQFIFSHMKESQTAHMINLVYDEKQPKDTLRFTLHHNGFGEGFAYEGNRSGYSESAGFACFNVSGMIPDGMESIPVKITAPWYETVEGDVRTGQTVDIVTRGLLKK